MSADATLLDLLGPAERIAVQYATSRSRDATITLLALDRKLASILRMRREPIVAQLRLAWWRDVLSQRPADWPAGEPVLEALGKWRDPAGLDQLATGWEALLAEELSAAAISEFTAGRGAAIATLARELGASDPDAARAAGEVWALADLAANISEGSEKELVVAYGRSRNVPRLAASLRPIAVLAGLGELSLRKGGAPLMEGPRSLITALRIGLSGR